MSSRPASSGLLNTLTPDEIRRRLKGDGLTLSVGPYLLCIQSRFEEIAGRLALMYGRHGYYDQADFIDFRIAVQRPQNLRRWYKPQALFYFDGHCPFKPLPAAHAYPLLEWGLNWVIAGQNHRYLILHAAVLVKNGEAIIMPGRPGSGKSTLSAAMAHQGWTLYSDELAMIEPEQGRVIPIVRPVSLKNDSIDIIRQAYPDAILSPPAYDTNKGTVAHMAAPEMPAAGESAVVKHIVFPRYQGDSLGSISPLARGTAFLQASTESFNYSLLGEQGFAMMSRLMHQVSCYQIEFPDLDNAITALESIHESRV